jgi:hypothetical protein
MKEKDCFTLNGSFYAYKHLHVYTQEEKNKKKFRSYHFVKQYCYVSVRSLTNSPSFSAEPFCHLKSVRRFILPFVAQYKGVRNDDDGENNNNNRWKRKKDII